MHPLLALLAAYTLYSTLRWVRLRRAMPPGPWGLPWIGNKHQLPASKPWTKFAEWNHRYGAVVSIFLGRTPVIVLGKAKPAWDLLEKRSDIYSSRPRFVVAGEIFSDNKRALLLPNNDYWRRWRRVLHAGFHAKQAATYKPIQSLESKLMIKQFLDDPAGFEKHLNRFAASISVSASYGRRVNSVDEWIVKENMDIIDYLVSINIPGKYLVESWPWLLKLPRSLQWFRHEPETQKHRVITFLMHLYNDVLNRMRAGTARECLTSQSIATIDKLGMEPLDLAYAAASPFGAGIETTAGTSMSFLLAMLHYPEVQRKAQAELDAVVGQDRMPEYDDQPNLPYLKALINETLRWRPVAILGGTPHAVTADDVYEGMFIPKGSTVYANFYGIMKDPEMFPNPETFRPERFLETTDLRLQSFDLPFGFGRRSCPGIHLALNSLYINIARILWAFDISPVEPGVLPDANNYTDGFNSRPRPFGCRFVPRGGRVVGVVDAEWRAAMPLLEQWD